MEERVLRLVWIVVLWGAAMTLLFFVTPADPISYWIPAGAVTVIFIVAAWRLCPGQSAGDSPTDRSQ